MENAPEKTASGLLLPEEARDKMNVGLVEAVGADASSESGASTGCATACSVPW